MTYITSVEQIRCDRGVNVEAERSREQFLVAHANSTSEQRTLDLYRYSPYNF